MTKDRESQLASYFDGCARDGDLAEFDADEQRRLDAFLELWRIEPGDRILEPGCGTGRLTRVLSEAVGPSGRVLAMDISAEMVERAHARGFPDRVDVVFGSVLRVPSDDGSFDKVLCLNVFPHFSDRGAVLREFARVTRDGGDLWINHFANREAINEFHHGCDPSVCDHLIPPDDEVRALVESAGFEVVSHDDNEPGYRLHAARRSRT